MTGAIQGYSDQPVSTEEVLAAFNAFSNFGAGALSPAKSCMDGPRFAKLCRETGLQSGKLNSIAVDIVFSKIKAKVDIDYLYLSRFFMGPYTVLHVYAFPRFRIQASKCKCYAVYKVNTSENVE